MTKTSSSVIALLLGVACLCASAQMTTGQRAMHVDTSFTVLVHAPAAEAAKLFTPEGERLWAGKDWDPQYVYPAGPSRDALGAVFTIHHGPVQAVWTVIRRDDAAGQYEYLYFIPEIMITSIIVHFHPLDAGTTQVHVKYGRTALSAEGEAHVQAMSNDDKNAGPAWQAAIEKYLRTEAPAAASHRQARFRAYPRCAWL